MNKILVLSGFLFLVACGGKDEKAAVADTTPKTLAASAHSDSFNLAFGKMLDHYFELKDQFIAENDTLIAQKSVALISDVAEAAVEFKDLKNDSTVASTARNYAVSISSELKSIVSETDREERRKSFQTVSEQIYDLIRAVKYDRAIVYHQYCPMAFNDAGAFWLSNSSDIRNPYLPKKMLTCGEVKDSIDFRKF